MGAWRAAGQIAEIWRYPVKSMQGERLAAADLGERGLAGDRAYALLDLETGTVASAKHPRRWAALLACAARYLAPPQVGAPPPPIEITLPDGARLRSDDPDLDAQLSRALGRAVRLIDAAPEGARRDSDRTPLDHTGEPVIRREPFALGAPAGTLFDYAPLHLLTTATLAELQRHHPAGAPAPRRFRPNLLVEGAGEGWAELAWLGATLAAGDARLLVIDPTPRCVVTTLAQGDLPHDTGVLRALAAHSSAASVTLAPGVVLPAIAGVYARAAQPGALRVGDALALEAAG